MPKDVNESVWLHLFCRMARCSLASRGGPRMQTPADDTDFIVCDGVAVAVVMTGLAASRCIRDCLVGEAAF